MFLILYQREMDLNEGMWPPSSHFLAELSLLRHSFMESVRGKLVWILCVVWDFRGLLWISIPPGRIQDANAQWNESLAPTTCYVVLAAGCAPDLFLCGCWEPRSCPAACGKECSPFSWWLLSPFKVKIHHPAHCGTVLSLPFAGESLLLPDFSPSVQNCTHTAQLQQTTHFEHRKKISILLSG